MGKKKKIKIKIKRKKATLKKKLKQKQKRTVNKKLVGQNTFKTKTGDERVKIKKNKKTTY